MKWLLFAIGLLIGIYFWLNSPSDPQIPLSEGPKISPKKIPPQSEVPLEEPLVADEIITEPVKEDVTLKGPTLVKYVIDDGIATAFGDIALGMLDDEFGPNTGQSVLETIKLWETSQIPYLIDSNISNPDQIRQALEVFNRLTSLKFIEHSNQKDGLVFTKTDGISKSYIGKVGGLQPIWIAANADTSTVIHEVMHALGFIHEQNRFDRDKYIQVQFENIEDEYKYNFEILNGEFMKMSGLSKFDFESTMIYPPEMFAKGGQSTMRAKTSRIEIRPSQTLSPLDIQRINRMYGHSPHQ